jgi:Ser/Thr protein kinase RdoA (MazF antagonist)
VHAGVVAEAGNHAALEELLSRWGLEPSAWQALARGTVKASWLNADKGLLLQLYPPAVPTWAVEQELAWTTALASAGVPEIPKVIPSNNDRLVEAASDGRSAVLRCFIEGTQLNWTDETCQAMASVLAAVHSGSVRLGLRGEGWFPPLRCLDWESNLWWDVSCLADLESNYPQITELRRQLDEVPKLFQRLEGLPTCLVHNDFHRGNLVASGSRIVGVLDWDWATFDWRILDVASGMRSWISLPRYGGPEPAVRFVDQYAERVGDFTAEERRLLPEVLWLRSLWRVLFDLGRASEGQQDPDELAVAFEARGRLLAILAELREALCGYCSGDS